MVHRSKCMNMTCRRKGRRLKERLRAKLGTGEGRTGEISKRREFQVHSTSQSKGTRGRAVRSLSLGRSISSSPTKMRAFEKVGGGCRPLPIRGKGPIHKDSTVIVARRGHPGQRIERHVQLTGASRRRRGISIRKSDLSPLPRPRLAEQEQSRPLDAIT